MNGDLLINNTRTNCMKLKILERMESLSMYVNRVVEIGTDADVSISLLIHLTATIIIIIIINRMGKE